MLRVVLLNQILHDATGLEKTKCLSVGECVCQSRDSSIGIDFEEPRFFLRVFGDVDRMGLVRDPVRPGLLAGRGALQVVTYPSSSNVMEILMPFGV